ncbi:hypothetical protein K435DRAFT_834041 [Dendrothele bispora CBS 962.96]|uniref:Mtf2-like C-terminal domain-containing protein n=1 Tax=Dendrothele bispora (strain CBS 962.96) TaxID=1314807 RepID=A0A4S8MUD9_DENBC|nr:hypothetical protein K435DRAFT_834041 [Dendrothele bispora CBS 962.96]
MLNRLSSATKTRSNRHLFYQCTRDTLVNFTNSQKLCRRNLATSFKACSAQGPSTPKSDSSSESTLFDSSQSAWDHVFKDIKNMPPLVPTTVRNPLRNQGPRRNRRQQMTARELSAFDDMFNMIFDAVAEQKVPNLDGTAKSDVALSSSGALGDLFGKLRRHSKKMRWTTKEDELLDQKKEEMDLCETDQQLLQWAMREVFGESERLEQASREAMAQAEAGKQVEFPMLQSPIYSHLVAHLMMLFREKYHDPHLALSIFDHARNLSIPSYVFGCSTLSYNELIKTRWTFFRDLKGVHDALQEMNVNAVDVNNATRKIVDQLRREVGERNIWVEEDGLGSGEVWNMLKKIEELLKEPDAQASGKVFKWDAWKTADSAEDWEFDNWDKPKSSPKRQQNRRD